MMNKMGRNEDAGPEAGGRDSPRWWILPRNQAQWWSRAGVVTCPEITQLLWAMPDMPLQVPAFDPD